MKRLALVGAGTLVGLLVAEVALRAVGFSDHQFWQPDPHRGFVPIPGSSGRYRAEGDGWVRYDDAGLRGPPRSLEKPPGVLRIAVLGDSFAEALQVDAEQAFWSILEAELPKCLGRPVEVINFGVSGYSTAQELMSYRHAVRPYDPDRVLLMFYAGNDVRDNSKAFGAADRPYFDLVDGALVYDGSFVDRPSYRSRTGALNDLYRRAKEHLRILHVVGDLRRRNKQRAVGSVAPAMEVLAEQTDPRWVAAWAVSEALLSALAREVREDGATLGVVAVGTSLQTHRDPRAREAVQAELRVEDLLYPERRLAALGAREGIEVLSLAEPMQRWAESNGRCLHGWPGSECVGHWNPEGHRVAATLMAAWLCAGR